ncbi:unnamed protein product [Medioppia subpectinata]|uniref:Uncharacterized protein n=1 Tax=Medioppia subpectinata TaxID=1979941 RepID=A0A7R9Q8D2_9ACAR|nr:unnamed protein product [Medioppia subpectinata]CAG2115719.1 unnamed protein product [Medioppia subpectinata]
MAQFTRIAFELISRYISEELITELSKTLGLLAETKESSVSTTSTQIKRKIDENESSVSFEDYSAYRGGTAPSTHDKKPAKMSRSQRELLKVDKTGMKKESLRTLDSIIHSVYKENKKNCKTCMSGADIDDTMYILNVPKDANE